MAEAEDVMGRVMCGRKVDELFLFCINYCRNIHHKYIIVIYIYVGYLSVYNNITKQILGWLELKTWDLKSGSLRFEFQLCNWMNVWSLMNKWTFQFYISHLQRGIMMPTLWFWIQVWWNKIASIKYLYWVRCIIKTQEIVTKICEKKIIAVKTLIWSQTKQSKTKLGEKH